MKYVKFLVVPILFVALAFMNIGGCGGGGGGGDGDGDGPDCADIAGIILFLFTETSNDCGEPLEPPFLVTTDCSQRGCSLNCTFTDDEGASIDTSGSISEDGIVDLFALFSGECSRRESRSSRVSILADSDTMSPEPGASTPLSCNLLWARSSSAAVR